MQCEVCGENATFSRQRFQEFDYEKFTQSPLSTVNLLSGTCLLSYVAAVIIIPDEMHKQLVFSVFLFKKSDIFAFSASIL